MTSSDTLVAVDDALARGRPDAADPELRELQEIGLALRADAPVPGAVFVSGLDERVARRFERPVRRRWLSHRRGVLAVAAGGGGLGGRHRAGSRAPPGGGGEPPHPPPGPNTGAGGAAPGPPPPGQDPGES